MKVAIVGYATEGIASAKYWHAAGHEITVCDQDPDVAVPDEYASQLGSDYLKNLHTFDVIVRSAGIHPKLLTDVNPGIESKITTNIEEFMRVCPTKNTIGVTGTKGKGTTSTLIAKMLEASGKKVHLAGNIGLPPLGILSDIEPDDWVVLELSSFQLEDFKGPSPHIAVCLMVVPEHLNWHADLDEYLKAKANLFRLQKPEDLAVYNLLNELSVKIASSSPGTKKTYAVPPVGEELPKANAYIKGSMIYYEETRICSETDVVLLGRHNLDNVCAAITAVWDILEANVFAIIGVLRSFKGLEHRLEFVQEIGGVEYYDDSFSTTPETAIAAIHAFADYRRKEGQTPVVMIVGGSDKGVPFDELAVHIAVCKPRKVLAIGETGSVIAGLLRKHEYNEIIEKGLSTMTEIVATAQSIARPGDVVLLSTGCASYDMFKDYKDRGEQFKKAVLELS